MDGVLEGANLCRGAAREGHKWFLLSVLPSRKDISKKMEDCVPKEILTAFSDESEPADTCCSVRASLFSKEFLTKIENNEASCHSLPDNPLPDIESFGVSIKESDGEQVERSTSEQDIPLQIGDRTRMKHKFSVTNSKSRKQNHVKDSRWCVFVYVFMLLADISCVDGSIHKKTLQSLPQKCWDLLQYSYSDVCPHPDRKPGAYTELTEVCCEGNTSFVCQQQDLLSDEEVFPACVPELFCQPGFYCILEISDGWPVIKQYVCNEDYFKSPNILYPFEKEAMCPPNTLPPNVATTLPPEEQPSVSTPFGNSPVIPTSESNNTTVPNGRNKSDDSLPEWVIILICLFVVILIVTAFGIIYHFRGKIKTCLQGERNPENMSNPIGYHYHPAAATDANAIPDVESQA